jgi:hypothetical protein
LEKPQECFGPVWSISVRADQTCKDHSGQLDAKTEISCLSAQEIKHHYESHFFLDLMPGLPAELEPDEKYWPPKQKRKLPIAVNANLTRADGTSPVTIFLDHKTS